MGLLDFLDGTKRAAKASATAATETLLAELTAVLPENAAVRADSWSVGFTTYTVAVTGTRRQLPALLSRLNTARNGLGRTDDLELRIAESADPEAVFSSLGILGKNRDPEVLDFLVGTHNELLDRFPGCSVSVDGWYGGFTVSGVAPEGWAPSRLHRPAHVRCAEVQGAAGGGGAGQRGRG